MRQLGLVSAAPIVALTSLLVACSGGMRSTPQLSNASSVSSQVRNAQSQSCTSVAEGAVTGARIGGGNSVDGGAASYQTCNAGLPATSTLECDQYAPPVAASSTVVPAQFSGLTSYLQSLVAPNGTLTGLGFIIVRNNQVVYENALGTYSTCTDVLIASASKGASVRAILSLVDRGLLNLDTPISKYVPNLFPNGTTITERMLLDHTSGINNCGEPVCSSTEGNYGNVLGDPCLLVGSDSMESCVQQIVNLGSIFTPGTQFDYGGDDYQVAGYVAQVVAGEPFTQLFQNAIAAPCGLTSTTYGDPLEAPPTNPRIGGGLYTTIGDMAKMLTIDLDGGLCNGTTRVLSTAMVNAMQADYTQGLPVFYSADPGHDYGMSWWHLAPLTGSPALVHDFGLFGAVPWLDKSCGYGAFLLMSDNDQGANKGLTVMDYIVNNELITAPLGCQPQTVTF